MVTTKSGIKGNSCQTILKSYWPKIPFKLQRHIYSYMYITSVHKDIHLFQATLVVVALFVCSVVNAGADHKSILMSNSMQSHQTYCILCRPCGLSTLSNSFLTHGLMPLMAKTNLKEPKPLFYFWFLSPSLIYIM